MPSARPKPYRRILLKLSGEALGYDGQGINPAVLDHTAQEVLQILADKVQVGIVIGGGNLFRGADLHAAGLDRVTGDHMGMLATVMNAMAMGDALERAGAQTVVMSAIPMDGMVETFDRRAAIHHLQRGAAVIFSGGTGNPFFTTDSAACLRGVEIGADLVLKATKVDGVYTADPVLDPTATRYDQLTYNQVLDKQLGVMDLTAICLARDHDMPLRVFAMGRPGALRKAVAGKDEGTLIVSD